MHNYSELLEFELLEFELLEFELSEFELSKFELSCNHLSEVNSLKLIKIRTRPLHNLSTRLLRF